MRDGYVYETKVPGVSLEEMFGCGNATRVCRTRKSMCDQAEREESTEGKGQAGNGVLQQLGRGIESVEQQQRRQPHEGDERLLQNGHLAAPDEVRLAAPLPTAAPTREDPARQQGQEFTSAEPESDGRHPQIDLVSRRLRTAFGGRHQTNISGKQSNPFECLFLGHSRDESGPFACEGLGTVKSSLSSSFRTLTTTKTK